MFVERKVDPLVKTRLVYVRAGEPPDAVHVVAVAPVAHRITSRSPLATVTEPVFGLVVVFHALIAIDATAMAIGRNQNAVASRTKAPAATVICP